MSDRDSRIFVYTPPKPEPQPMQPQPDDSAETARAWLLSPIGAVCVWLLVLGLIVPASALVLVILREDLARLAVGCGLWLVLGLAVIHWWIPAGQPGNSHSEGLATAGWHILISLLATGSMAWLMLEPEGLRPTFTLSEIPPMIVVGTIILITSGTILTLLRGHPPGRGLRYAWTLLCMLAVWMTLWLLAAHSGL